MHRRSTPLASLTVPLVIAAAVLRPARAGETCPPALDAIAPAVEAFLAQNPRVPGASVRLERGGIVLYERTFGSYTLDTAVPIASATKWLSAGVIMSLVDEGVIALDDPIGLYLPSFSAPPLNAVTFRHCFAHTSGLPGNAGAGLDDCSPCLNDRFTTLQQCAAEIAAAGLRTGADGQPVTPGSDFAYGGCSMQAAGAAAEIASGRTWNQLFQQRLSGPLGMTATGFGPGPNPRIGGGVSSTLREYASYLAMIVAGGISGQTRLLSPEAIDVMLADQTNGVPVTYTPPTAADFAGYGVGNWVNLQGATDASLLNSSEGAFGFSPWIDARRSALGVFLVRDQNEAVRPLVEFIQQTLRTAVDTSPDVNASGTVDFADIVAVLRNFNRLSFPGSPNGPGPIGDVSGNGAVDFADITSILSLFGEPCP
ncbi:MAG: serine hydrolase [Planctomycetota bacterium]|nr:serine hydrolase [Planctomycetota bacterium]